MKTAKHLVAAAVGTVLIAACASTPKTLPEVEQARTAVETLARDPMAEQSASKELSDARSSLQGADTAVKEGRKEDALHYAYLASQQAQAGEARVNEHRAKEQVSKGEAERNKVLLEARTNEAEQAAAAAKAQAAAADAARHQTEEMQRQLTELQAKQTDRGMVLTLGDVLFDTAAATLKPGADSVMERVATFMEKNPETKVIIEGHTDSRGSDEYNQELSKRRAAAVQEALASRGIDRSRVEAVGKGEGFPVASNDTNAGRQQNRRVEIVFSDKQGQFASGSSSAYR